MYLSQHYKPNFYTKNIIWLKFTINYSLFKLDNIVLQFPWLQIRLCVCTKRECVKFTEFVCKAVRLAFSWQTSAISLPLYSYFLIKPEFATVVGDQYNEDDFLLIMLWSLPSIYQITSLQANKKLVVYMLIINDVSVVNLNVNC